jgi:hypothetical protein
MRSVALTAEYLWAMRKMSLEDARELMRYRIPLRAIATVCPAPTYIAFNGAADRFYPDETGYKAWVIPICVAVPAEPDVIEAVDPLDVISTGPVIDLVAFHPAFPDHWALRTGTAAVLGAIEPQYCDSDPVPVHRDISDWLRGGCSGIVLLTHDRHEAHRTLCQIQYIDTEDKQHKRELEALAAVPRPVSPRITVRTEPKAAA